MIIHRHHQYILNLQLLDQIYVVFGWFSEFDPSTQPILQRTVVTYNSIAHIPFSSSNLQQFLQISHILNAYYKLWWQINYIGSLDNVRNAWYSWTIKDSLSVILMALDFFTNKVESLGNEIRVRGWSWWLMSSEKKVLFEGNVFSKADLSWKTTFERHHCFVIKDTILNEPFLWWWDINFIFFLIGLWIHIYHPLCLPILVLQPSFFHKGLNLNIFIFRLTHFQAFTLKHPFSPIIGIFACFSPFICKHLHNWKALEVSLALYDGNFIDDFEYAEMIMSSKYNIYFWDIFG